MSVRVLTLALVLGLSATALAEDWPRWRGPNNDGISKETGLLKSWPQNGPPLVWTAKNLGTGFGAPSVAEGKIYGMGTRDGKDGMWALTEANGKELWFSPFDDPKNPSQNNGPGSTPTVGKGKVYGVSNKGTLVCLDTKTGNAVWQKSYLKDFGGGVPSWGYNDSVLLDGDKLICSPCGRQAAVVALNPDTGEVIWKTETNPGGAGGYSSPVKATIGGIPMYIVLLGKGTGVVGVHADTGKLLWNYAKVANGTANIPTVIVRDNLVWCSSGYRDGGAALVQITPQGTEKCEAKEVVYYGADELQNHHGGMVLVGDYVYFGRTHGQGYPSCVEFKTGDIKWKQSEGAAGGRGSAGVAYADGRLYFRYENGVMVLIEPDPKGLKVVSSFKLPPPNTPRNTQSWPHPVIANGKLYIRDQNHLYCYNVKSAKG